MFHTEPARLNTLGRPRIQDRVGIDGGALMGGGYGRAYNIPLWEMHALIDILWVFEGRPVCVPPPRQWGCTPGDLAMNTVLTCLACQWVNA